MVGSTWLWLVPPASLSRAALDAAFTEAGYTPRVVLGARALPMVVQLASLGLGVGIVPASSTHALPDTARVLRISRPQVRSRLEIAWVTGTATNPARGSSSSTAENSPRRWIVAGPNRPRDDEVQRVTERELNRWTLARQLLLQRTARPVIEVIEHLIGLQAQTPMAPYFGLWSRVAEFVPDRLEELIAGRSAVRTAVMRSTVHLVSARDSLRLRPLVQPVLDRQLQSVHGAALRGLDWAVVAAATCAVLGDDGPLTPKELGAGLARRWPRRDAEALGHAARNLVPLVQVPPRGLWKRSGQTRYTTTAAWLATDATQATEADQPHSLRDLVLRYLAAFGPASAADFQTWSGLTGVAAVIDELRPDLIEFRDRAGRPLFDLPDALRPEPDTPAPPRLVAPYDNLLLSYADRTRVMAEEDRRRLTNSPNGVVPGAVLVDGFVQGSWTVQKQRKPATIRVVLHRALSSRNHHEVEAEATRLAAWVDPGCRLEITH